MQKDNYINIHMVDLFSGATRVKKGRKELTFEVAVNALGKVFTTFESQINWQWKIVKISEIRDGSIYQEQEI